MTNSEKQFDIVIIGYGPVGATAAVLFAQKGLTVAVIEKEPEIFNLPRAALFDGEIARVFQNIGVLDRLQGFIEPMKGGGFRAATGDPIGPDLVYPEGFIGAQGHPETYVFHQPGLEKAIRNRAAELGVTTWLGHLAGHPTEDETGVEIEVTPTKGGSSFKVRGTWLIAADGAASPVREYLGIDWGSLGYDRDWIVMDLILKNEIPSLPDIGVQVCDPARIHTFVPMVGNRRRWEFIVNRDEKRSDMLREDRLWDLLSRYLTPADADIERAAGYQFHAAISAQWRRGRIFLAGDAAHQTPPFLGQGMCTGIRDVANLAWKIDHVLRCLMPDRILDSYEAERRPHALDTVDHAVAIGQLMDAFAQAQLDGNWPTDLSAVYGGERGRLKLDGGIVSHRPEARAGGLSAQPLLSSAVPCLLDDLVGTGFRLFSQSPVAPHLSPDLQRFAKMVGMTFVDLSAQRLDGDRPGDPLDGSFAVLVRPDHYVFGHAATPRDLDILLAEARAFFA